ncbi:hypothetical protein QYF52_25670 [Paenibacillus polymyxa]|uniref:hypothetical protein n=1 Tax=Paenibacillus polymyxa TaxID=1406 RepID=UPI0025B6672E|nr:hypothetical protein [Paenibacillus polymyxa]MDN4081318.1 hypothetical protein [Paenibacillus polymyxa]MDN4116960.1 hypothetical protein [Paenibacillus polymyxa]
MNEEGAQAQPEQSISAQGDQAITVQEPSKSVQEDSPKSELQQSVPVTEQPQEFSVVEAKPTAVTQDVYVVNQPGELREQTLVELPNGNFIAFSSEMTLGDAVVASSIFLLIAFLVLKWLLDTAWGRK